MAGQGDRRVLIVGGGIGGLTLANALRRKGLTPVVFERWDDPSGKGVHLWANATRALKRIGLLDRILPVSNVEKFSEYRTASGKLLTRWAVAAYCEQIGAPSLGISRPDLLGALAEALPDDAVRRGANCTGFSMDETGVTAHFADGGEERGDVLIGADGIHSIVRTQLWGRIAPAYSGETVWRAIIPFEHPEKPAGVFEMHHGPGQRFLTYHVGGGKMLWLAAKNAPEGGRDAPGEAKERLLAMFKGWADPIPQIIAATEAAEFRRNDVCYLPDLKTWGAGRVTLLGDAAHAMTIDMGQGACIAIEDAYVLAEKLAVENDVNVALREYEAARQKRATRVAHTARRLGDLNRWEHPLACVLRDQIMMRGSTPAWMQFKRTLNYQY